MSEDISTWDVSRPTTAIEIGPDYFHKGAHYAQVLVWLHEYLKPRSYLEIGTAGGASLQLAKCASIAVDPMFRLTVDVIGAKPCLMQFQTGSDQFFAEHNPETLLGRKVDLAFLDGLHFFEFLLRDFINTEKACARNSIIAMHDCLPLDHYMTSRTPLNPADSPSKYTDWWTGDVWKIVPVLRKFRPELQIVCLDAPPTGLVLCTNLQPGSSVLTEAYFDIVAEWRDLTLETYSVERFLREAGVASTKVIQNFESAASRFWL